MTCRGIKLPLVQTRRNKRAAPKLMRKLLKKYGFVPDKLVTDELRSYAAAASDFGIANCHERGRWRNNRAENSHQPTRRRERMMQGFKSVGPRKDFSQCMQQHKILSTSSAISPQQERVLVAANSAEAASNFQ
jgi:transposase-like protein